MDGFLLTPESIRTLSLVILNLAITLYLARIREKSEATWWLATFTGGMTLFYLMRFVEASVFPLGGIGALADLRMAIEFLVVPVALGAFVQFAYRFLEHPFPREAKMVLWLTGMLFAGFAVYCAYILLDRRDVTPLYLLYSSAWLGFCALATIVLLRKSRRLHPNEGADLPGPLSAERARRAYHAFAGLSALFAIILLVIILQVGLQWLPRFLWVAIILPGVFAFFSGLVVVYVNHAPEPTTFQVKLVGLSLATMLAVLGMTAVVLYLPGEMVRESDVLPPDGQTIRFAPDTSGGYHVRLASLPRDEALGNRLELEERRTTALPLGFSFPYSGTHWDSVTVDKLGVIVFGQPGLPPRHGYQPHRYSENPLPKIAPLFGFTPAPNLSTVAAPDIFLRRSPGTLSLTWRYPMTPDTSALALTQLVLHESGTIRFAYHGLAAVASHAPIGLSRTIRGLHPGGAVARLRSVRFATTPSLAVPAGTGVVENLGQPFRQYVHGKSVRLLGLLLGTTLFILLVFPFVFRSGLLRPLDRLLKGVRRVNAGELDTDVPVGVRDEIGRLTENFNQMTRSLRTAEAELKAYAEELEDRVAERTAALEASKAQLEAQARQLRKLDELKTRFFANISHEFRTPLTLILGPLQDVLEERSDAEDLAHHVPTMYRNARRLLRLINQLLDLSKLEAGSMHLRARRTDLVAFLRRIVHAFTARAEREQLTLLFDPSTDALPCYVDRDKLEKIVTNLLSNALKFTPAGGKVRVSAERIENEAGGAAEITVEDTGRGISPDDLPHIFDRFHQVDGSPTRDQEGTGVGLALAKELVELHRGTITVASKEHFGTTFTVQLPLGTDHFSPGDIVEGELSEEGVRPRSRTSETLPSTTKETLLPKLNDPEEAEGESSSTPTLLIVEDNPDMRRFLCDHLEPDYRVVEADDGAEGWEQVQALDPDLVIADVMMPQMDGFALAEAIKTDDALNHIPVVLLTARADEASKLEGLEAGADDYLTKPFSAGELLARVENLIEVRRQLRERFSQEVVIEPSEVVVSSAEAAWLEKVRKVVEAHLSDTNFTVDWLADEVGLSTRQLQRRLKDATSLTPSGYIRMMRLERAAQLLEQRAGTISEIAYTVGFNDAAYFSKLFRQVFGTPPSEYAPNGT